MRFTEAFSRESFATIFHFRNPFNPSPQAAAIWFSHNSGGVDQNLEVKIFTKQGEAALLMRVLAPNIKNIAGTSGVAEVLIAGYDSEGNPTYKGAFCLLLPLWRLCPSGSVAP